MRRTVRILTAALTGMVLAAAPDPTAAAAGEPVAIVCLLSGDAFARVGGKGGKLELFQRLTSGTVVSTAAGSKVILAFLTGDRYELDAGAAVTLGRAGLSRSSGPVSQLPRVPAIADIAPIAKDERPGTRMAGTRIRTGGTAAGSIANLYPSMGAAVIADRAAVGFDPVAGHEKYRVELENERGESLLVVETVSTTVDLPAAALRAGRTYYWSVRTLDARTPVLRGEAMFRTVDAADVRRRAAFEAHVEQARDVSLLTLLAAVDWNLGLHQEACESLETAVDRGGDRASIGAARSRFGCSRE
jgi:hypothetical protein